MSAEEWNDQFMRRLARDLGTALEPWAADFWRLYRMAEAEHARADQARAELATLKARVEGAKAICEQEIGESEEFARLGVDDAAAAFSVATEILRALEGSEG